MCIWVYLVWCGGCRDKIGKKRSGPGLRWVDWGQKAKMYGLARSVGACDFVCSTFENRGARAPDAWIYLLQSSDSWIYWLCMSVENLKTLWGNVYLVWCGGCRDKIGKKRSGPSLRWVDWGQKAKVYGLARSVGACDFVCLLLKIEVRGHQRHEFICFSHQIHEFTGLAWAL